MVGEKEPVVVQATTLLAPTTAQLLKAIVVVTPMMPVMPAMLMAAMVSGLKMAALQAVLVAMEEKKTVLLRSVMVDVKGCGQA